MTRTGPFVQTNVCLQGPVTTNGRAERRGRARARATTSPCRAAPSATLTVHVAIRMDSKVARAWRRAKGTGSVVHARDTVDGPRASRYIAGAPEVDTSRAIVLAELGTCTGGARLMDRRVWRSTMAESSSAIVLGASLSGLLAARALSNHFDRIIIVERDGLSEGPELRKGVPQAAHAHGLLASGYRVMDAYFPGLMDELEAVGAPRGDVVRDFLWFQYGRWKLRYASGLRGITVSRPCLETTICRGVRELPNVRFLEEYDAVKPCFDVAAGAVAGLRVKSRDRKAEDTVAADLVVDATGRGSQSPAWLEEWGFSQPKLTTLKIDVGYATGVFERKPGDFFNSVGGVVAGAPPAETRTGAVLAAEGNRWVITLVGSVGDYPTTNRQEWTK